MGASEVVVLPREWGIVEKMHAGSVSLSEYWMVPHVPVRSVTPARVGDFDVCLMFS